MEQQTLSIAKAGIICQLNARTSILAAANPSESQWNKNKTIIENVQLPHTLLSRFDLIFLLLDPQNELFDRRLAKHLVSLYYKTRQEEDDEVLVRFSVCNTKVIIMAILFFFLEYVDTERLYFVRERTHKSETKRRGWPTSDPSLCRHAQSRIGQGANFRIPSTVGIFNPYF